MHAAKLKKIAAGTALAISALGATSVAQAGTTPQKHPDTNGQIIGVLGHGQIIAVLKHHNLITIRKAG